MEKPLADLLRPTSLDEVFGQKHLLSKNSTFRKVIESKKVPNMIFYGSPGIGKTTVANIIAKNSNLKLYKLNGTTCSTEDIKKIIDDVSSLFNQEGILLYLDEIQYLNKKQQQSLLEFVENGDITLIASTTENPYFYVYPALRSRCNVFEFKPLSVDDIKEGLLSICKKLEVNIDDDALLVLSTSANGDMRKAITNLEFLLSSLDKDKHFDTLSAFMKSLRGSDPDAAIFYLAKLLEGGDLIAASRRLLCSVNEDVGLAYPQLIPIVKACVDSALQLGMPEARLPLSNATLLIANAPKSNSSYLAYASAFSDINMGKGVNVPRQLQNTHFDGKDARIKGQHYKYPHDYKNHYIKQQYLPDDIKTTKYYHPQDNKNELMFKEYWDKIKKE